jgi:ABC-type nitrate/sulfonate/bicarbonate transport system substrate-binding protein
LNNKIIAGIVVAIVAIAAVGAGLFFFLQENDREINVLAAVNIEGSGIYIDKNIDVNTMFDFSTDVPTPIASGWAGKVFGTPGMATIQHVQILSLVSEMGLKQEHYRPESYNPNSTDTVYVSPNIPNAVTALGTDYISGGILWQPQYQKIIEDKSQKRDFKALALTNDLFPGHSCCIIAGNHSFTSKNPDVTVRFLTAYVRAVDWVNNALSDPVMTNSNYAKLVNSAKRVTGQAFTDQEVIEALKTVTYTHGGDLSELTSNIAKLSDDLMRLGQTSGVTMKDLGFNNGTEFANKFVDNSYLLSAQSFASSGEKPAGSDRTVDLKVAVISGDIHQIALHMAIELGYFQEYGLNVTPSSATNGPGIATSIQNGDSSFGLLGAPPMTITVISGKLVTA